MRIATWNVNSVRQRLDHLLTWLRETSPDVACLQEIKCVDEQFPREAIEALGYNVVTHGQKTFNGVALLSKLPFDETRPRLAGDDDDVQSRFLEGVVSLKHGVVRVACLYLPNGNPANTEKYPYKLKWMSRLIEYSRERLKSEETFVLAGDFNVIPTDGDVYKPERWLKDALFAPEARERYRELVGQGWTDAIRHLHPDERVYTFWHYWRNSFERDAGIRIDHALLSPTLVKGLKGAGVDRTPRGWEKTSDHAPIWVEVEV